MNKLIFVNKDPESYILQLNQLHGILPEGKNGKWAHTGEERIDGQGKTINYMLPVYHPTDETKWYFEKLNNLPQNIIDDSNYEIEGDNQSLIDDGWIIEH